MLPTYPNLTAEIAKRGIRPRDMAAMLDMSSRTLSNKMKGKTAFTWPEACKLKNKLFPDCEYEYIFTRQSTG